jgi:hypothetical protein
MPTTIRGCVEKDDRQRAQTWGPSGPEGAPASEWTDSSHGPAATTKLPAIPSSA